MADEVAAREAADAVRAAFPAPSAQVLERVEAVITVAARERAGGASPVTVLESRRRPPAVLRAAACLLVVLLALPTATAATAQTLPGDTWHPVQIALERLWVTAAPGGLASARVELRLAGRRLVAAEEARDAGRDEMVTLLLGSFHRHLVAAERLGGPAVAPEVAALRARAAAMVAPSAVDGAGDTTGADHRPPGAPEAAVEDPAGLAPEGRTPAATANPPGSPAVWPSTRTAPAAAPHVPARRAPAGADVGTGAAPVPPQAPSAAAPGTSVGTSPSEPEGGSAPDERDVPRAEESEDHIPRERDADTSGRDEVDDPDGDTDEGTDTDDETDGDGTDNDDEADTDEGD